MMIAAIIVDNGEELFEKSLLSLRDQTVEPYIIVASGPKTDLELAKSLADKVIEPTKGMGKARVKAILSTECKYVFSCDSDVIYEAHYVEEGVKSLQEVDFVKAGQIYTLNGDMLGKIETWAVAIYPYEFTLAFRREAFFKAELHNKEYYNRIDISHYINFFIPPNPNMICYARLPSYFVKNLLKLLIYET